MSIETRPVPELYLVRLLGLWRGQTLMTSLERLVTSPAVVVTVLLLQYGLER